MRFVGALLGVRVSPAQVNSMTAHEEEQLPTVTPTEESVTPPAVEDIEIDDKMISRVGRIQDAYAAGDIDESMLARAAKTIGISEEEARRRLSARVTPRGHGTGSQTDRRKRAKQARASRKRNRG